MASRIPDQCLSKYKFTNSTQLPLHTFWFWRRTQLYSKSLNCTQLLQSDLFLPSPRVCSSINKSKQSQNKDKHINKGTNTNQVGSQGTTLFFTGNRKCQTQVWIRPVHEELLIYGISITLTCNIGVSQNLGPEGMILVFNTTLCNICQYISMKHFSRVNGLMFMRFYQSYL